MDTINFEKQIANTIQQNFQDAIIVNVNKFVYNVCLDFATNVNKTTCYEDCGQTNLDKRIYDNVIGKLGEWAVYAVLSVIGKRNNFTIPKPDCQVYEKKNKSWASDFAIHKNCEENDNSNGSGNNQQSVNISVKSQAISQATKYSFSGTFQYSQTRKDSVFKFPNEMVFLCLVDDRDLDNIRVLIMPPKTISQIKFGEPKLKYFVGFKTCYYVRDNFEKAQLKKWFDEMNISEQTANQLLG